MSNSMFKRFKKLAERPKAEKETSGVYPDTAKEYVPPSYASDTPTLVGDTKISYGGGEGAPASYEPAQYEQHQTVNGAAEQRVQSNNPWAQYLSPPTGSYSDSARLAQTPITQDNTDRASSVFALDGKSMPRLSPAISSPSAQHYGNSQDVGRDSKPVASPIPRLELNDISVNRDLLWPPVGSERASSRTPGETERSSATSNVVRRSNNLTTYPITRSIGSVESQALSNSSRSAMTASSKNSESPPVHNLPSIVIIVIGSTGAGKSRFVSEATGLDIDVGHSLVSHTTAITPYEISLGDRDGVLIDTPGFDDSTRTDVVIFRDVADWLARQHAQQQLITSIVYVHQIIDRRVVGGALRNLTVVKKMLGMESFRNLVLVTSMWDLVVPEVGEAHEKELSENSWRDLIRAGARVQRFHGNKQSALKVLEEMRFDAKVTLTIQRELVDNRLQLDQTTAGVYSERETLRDKADKQSSIYLDAEELNKDDHKHTPSERSFGRDFRNNVGRSRMLRAYWDTGSRSLNQDKSDSQQHKPDPEMYKSFEWENDFRLIVLRAGSGTTPVEVSLIMADVSHAPEFVALSYVIGVAPADTPINFRRDEWLSQLYISHNLKEALQHLRLPNTDVLVWVDVLSINQSDSSERARQVRMMSQIFAAAARVCIWLGPSTEGGDLAMDFMRSILDFDLLEDLVKNGQHQQKWLLLAKLVSRPWFRHRWVVQDLMFARDATVHCGDRVITWDDFCDATTLFRTKWTDIQRNMGDIELTELGDAHLLGAIALIETSQRVFRRDADGNIVEKLLSSEDLLSLLPLFEVSDPLDTVYAILDMANDVEGPQSVIVNYHQQPAELFRDTVKLVVDSTGSLDIICRPWAPKIGLPSWITTIAKHTYKRRTNRPQYDRQNGTSLVGMPGSPLYRACGTMRATPENTSFRIEGDQQVLTVTGHQLGRVSDLGGRSINGSIPQEWMEMAGWQSLDEPCPPAFWRTIVANRAVDGSVAPAWYGRACEFAFRKSTTDDINTTALIRSAPASHVQDFLNRVLDVTWRRTFALIKDDNTVYCALCPPETMVNDVVCILYGCSVPVVLRRLVSYYQLVGECFVYGVMDGEAIDQDPTARHTFDII